MNAAVLVIGRFGRHPSVLASTAEQVPLLHLVPMPQLTEGSLPDWRHRGLIGMHRDEPPEHWTAMARALQAGRTVGLVWCIDDQHSDIAARCAEALGVPVLGVVSSPVPTAGQSDIRVRVVRSGATLTILSVTRLVRDPGTAHVLAEIERGDDPAGREARALRRLLEEHVPVPFLGSVELRLAPDSPEVLALIPWRAGDGTRELLHGRGRDLNDIVLAATIGRPLRRDLSPPDDYRAIAALGTEAAGTLIAIEGIEAAKAVPGVREVVRLFQDGDRVGALSATGDHLIRVCAEANEPDEAFAAAREALSLIQPIVDVPADFAGALERMWF